MRILRFTSVVVVLFMSMINADALLADDILPSIPSILRCRTINSHTLDRVVLECVPWTSAIIVEQTFSASIENNGEVAVLPFDRMPRTFNCEQLIRKQGSKQSAPASQDDVAPSASVVDKTTIRPNEPVLSPKVNGRGFQNRIIENSLFMAAERGDSGKVAELVSMGARINAVGNFGNTAIFSAIQNDHADVLATLIELGSNMQHMNEIGATPLHWAAMNISLATGELLLRSGVMVDAIDNEGETALFSAIFRQDEAFVMLLLRNGASVNSRNNVGDTPLHLAARKKNLKIIELLLAAGANVLARNNDGATTVDIALRTGGDNAVIALVGR